jgi:hypothetical protein
MCRDMGRQKRQPVIGFEQVIGAVGDRQQAADLGPSRQEEDRGDPSRATSRRTEGQQSLGEPGRTTVEMGSEKSSPGLFDWQEKALP